MGWRSYPTIDEAAEPDAFTPRAKNLPTSVESNVAATLAAYGYSATRSVYDDGDKFDGGFGPFSRDR